MIPKNITHAFPLFMIRTESHSRVFDNQIVQKVSYIYATSAHCILYTNQSFDLQCKSNDWFIYEMQNWAETGYGMHSAIWHQSLFGVFMIA